jgi:hypothetical protein
MTRKLLNKEIVKSDAFKSPEVFIALGEIQSNVFPAPKEFRDSVLIL